MPLTAVADRPDVSREDGRQVAGAVRL